MSDLRPPKLTNDCFSLPPGVDWTPVDAALKRLSERVRPVVSHSTIASENAVGRVLAEDVVANRANPPAANSAVDGYGFAHADLAAGENVIPLVDGRAAAGAPFVGTIPSGYGIRILTGALLPDEVDTVVLEEDTNTDGSSVAFNGPLKKGSNTRKAGEDFQEKERILTAGQKVTPATCGVLAAAGVTQVSVFRRLRVGVMSTGDEIVVSGSTDETSRTYDANRPMLISLLDDWGFEAVDLGHSGDSPAKLQSKLDQAAEDVDVILTSGGASAGDEDHIAAVLRENGSLADWRIALKPGRPLALGVWNGAPIFGLPGNPVAALVCTLVFVRPALGVLGGEGWFSPASFLVPAAFRKSKKAGRREFLRARLDASGAVEVFPSEGSGRISGLSWADGLVELGDEAQNVELGTPVRYIPFSSFR